MNDWLDYKGSGRTSEKISKIHVAYDTVDVGKKSLDNALSNFVMK